MTPKAPCDVELHMSNWLGSSAQLFGQDVAVKAFVDVINIYNQQTLSKSDYPPYCGWTSSNQLKALKEKTEVS